ncbi:MAG: hypothetical protein HC896_13230 [Bacteroidales bacterium]|nr:hypothetical protein [Bacteroidales bacterium]
MPCHKKDIDDALLSGVDGVNISFPVSDIHLQALDKDWHWVMGNLPNIVNYARQRFMFVSVGAQDASRASMERLREFIDDCNLLKVHRVRIADTVGIMAPAYTPFTELTGVSRILCLNFTGTTTLAWPPPMPLWPCRLVAKRLALP